MPTAAPAALAARTVPLTWTVPAPGAMPDAYTTVLLWLRDADGAEDWCSGWLDADGWRDCASGGLVAGQGVAWADVLGPGHACRSDQQLAVDVAMLEDALAPLIAIVESRVSGLGAQDWHALEDARQAIAQAGHPDVCGSRLRLALQEADTLLGHDDAATEWREKWAGLWNAKVTGNARR